MTEAQSNKNHPRLHLPNGYGAKLRGVTPVARQSTATGPRSEAEGPGFGLGHGDEFGPPRQLQRLVRRLPAKGEGSNDRLAYHFARVGDDDRAI